MTATVADALQIRDHLIGRSKSDRGKNAFPEVRIVSLIENGTRVMFGTRFGSYTDCSEKELAREVLPFLKRGMDLIWLRTTERRAIGRRKSMAFDFA